MHHVDIPFATSERSTIGVEWELAIVERDSGELSPRAAEVLERSVLEEGSGAHVAEEFLTNTVELISGVHRRVAGAVAELGQAFHAVDAAAGPLGLALLSAGTHPFSRWETQRVTDKQRYATLVERTTWWGRQLLIWGTHVHVGVEDRAKVMPIIDGLLRYYPHLQALSASSPYWLGEDTGYASNRALLYQQIPTAGLPPQFRNWREYEGIVGDLLHTGVVDSHTELRWDIRPSPQWGTVEVRICDAPPTLREVGALAALVQCLVEMLSEQLDRGEEIPTLPAWYVRENKWRAARYGLDTILIRDRDGDERLVTDDLAELLTRLEPIARRLECTEELGEVAWILEHSAGYQRLQRAAARRGGDLRQVVHDAVEETRSGMPAR